MLKGILSNKCFLINLAALSFTVCLLLHLWTVSSTTAFMLQGAVHFEFDRGQTVNMDLQFPESVIMCQQAMN